MKLLYDKFYQKTRGFYPFFKYCPRKYWENYIKKRAFDALGYEYDYNSPKTLNEKIRWLLYNEKPELKTRLSDKILVKSFAAEKLGPNHTAELYGVWDNFKDIPFNALPNSFALKANHGWRMNIIVKNKAFIYKHYKDLNSLTKKWLKINYEEYSAEPQYRNIKRKLFAEYLRLNTFLTREAPGGGRNSYYRSDFKVHCFNEEPKFIEIALFLSNNINKTPPNLLYHDFQFYNCKWELQPFSCIKPLVEIPQEKPAFLEEMLEYSKILSKGFSYVRIDFAPSPPNLHVVEMTFSPHSTFMPIIPVDYDRILGDMLQLPELDKKT